MSFRRVLAVCLWVALFAAAASAGTLTFDFESPFKVGDNINGQQGWSNTGLYDAVVSNGAGANGSSQSLRISNGVTSGSFGDQTFTPHMDVPAGETSIPGALNMFQASWMFKSVTGSLQDGLFISVSADNGAGARMTWVGMGEDSTNGLYLGFYDWDKALFDSQGVEAFRYRTLATNLDLAAWHTVDMKAIFQDGPSNDWVGIWLDNRFVGSGTTWEDFYRFYPGDGGGGGLSPVNSLLFRAGGNPVPDNKGKGFYIDNVTLASAETPEPGTVGLLLAGIGGMVALARRRRSGR